MSGETNIRETRRRLDEHRQLNLGRRVIRRLTGEYPSYLARHELRSHELDELPEHEKIQNIVKNADFYIARYNASLLRTIFRATVRTGQDVDKRIIATEALAPNPLIGRRVVAGLCEAGGRPDLLQDTELTRHGYYIPRKKSERRDVAVGLYLANEDMTRIEKVPFSEDAFTALPFELQRDTEREAASLARHSHYAPPYESWL